MTEIKIFMIRQNEWGRHVVKQFSPGENSKWENITSVENIKDADYIVFISTPSIQIHAPPEKMIFFIGEPNEFHFTKQFWANVPQNAHAFPIEEYGMPAFWHILKNYDQLKNNPFPIKTKNLSWITTKFGDGTEPHDCQVLSGHRLRANFLKKLCMAHPDKFTLYGRKLLNYAQFFMPDNFHNFGGELADKWDGVKDFRYTIGIENSSQKNYFTGKFTDAILSGCCPLYWGAPNIGELFPKNSYIWIDITKESTVDEIPEIIKSDFREVNLDEIEAAKKLVLDKFNMWNLIAEQINQIDKKIKL